MKSYSYASKIIFSGLCLVTSLSAFGSMLLVQEEVIDADGYNKTYNDPSKNFKERMQGARETPVVTVDNRGGFFLGVNGAFGPVYDAEPTSTSGMGFGFGVEPGFVIQSDSWSRIEIGLQVAYNSFSWKDDGATVSMKPLSFLPRVGWGTSLGNNLFGVMKLGFGLSNGQLEAKQDSYTVKSNSASGMLISADYDVVYGVGAMQFTGGLGVIHHKYSWSSATSGSIKADIDTNTNLNFINLHGGARMQF
jgi:hypothetical protein